MKTTIKIFTRPFPKQRPRLYKGKAYTPKKTHDYEALIASSYKEQSDKYFDDKFIKIKMTFQFEVPKSYDPKKASEALKGNIRPSRNDIDNLIKSVLDGLNTVAFKDDRQVYELVAEKKFGSQNCVIITIESME